MGEYRKIMVALDSSSHSNAVLERAIQLAGDHSASLVLVHVVEYLPPIVMGDEPFTNSAWGVDEERLLEEAKTRLKGVTSTIHGLEVKSHVVLGNVRQELDAIAKQEDVDLLVAGSHGRHGFARLLGSTAAALVHDVSCDLLLVKLVET